jgi:hypothetical protein
VTADRSAIARKLPRRRWSAKNYDKIIDFLAAHAGSSGLALFDADNTAWTGDLGDSALVHQAQSLRLSPRLSDVLPEQVEVPAEGFGVRRPGCLFAAARVREAQAAMAAAYRRALAAPSASVDAFLGAFSERLVLPGGPLHGDRAFLNAHRVYAGTIIAVYNLLEASVGCLAFDASRPTPATDLFPERVRAHFGGHIHFPRVLDTEAGQAGLRACAKLGSYSQIAVWAALDKTPSEVRAIGLEVFGAPRDERPYEAVFPVDQPGAASPAPLDFAVDLDRFEPGGALGEGVVLGATAMTEGTRARPEIADLFAAMVRLGIVPVVITASHVDLVRAVLDQHYGFAGHPVVGMVPVLEGGRYGADLTAPATYRHGKVLAARAVARRVTGREDARPVFAAGDTTTDLEMLAYADGLRLFFDRNKGPFMDFASWLVGEGEEARTLVQAPF